MYNDIMFYHKTSEGILNTSQNRAGGSGPAFSMMHGMAEKVFEVYCTNAKVRASDGRPTGMKCTSMCSFMIIGIMVIEFRFFNLNKRKKKKYEELQYCIFVNISYHIQHIFTNF